MAGDDRICRARILNDTEVRQISRSIRSFVPTSPAGNDEVKAFEILVNDVLYTCGNHGLSAGHRVGAWNTLCSLIDQSLKSNDSNIQNFIWNNHVWTRSFEIYLSQAQNARPKSSRQLLTSLVSSLHKHSNQSTNHIIETALDRLLALLTNLDNVSKAKASAQFLGSLLAKDVVSLDLILCTHEIYAAKKMKDSKTGFQALLTKLFQWLGEGDFGSTIAQLVTTLLDKFEEREAVLQEPYKSRTPVWSVPLENAFRQSSIHANDLRAHILPTLFKRSFSSFVTFLYAQGLEGLVRPGRDNLAAIPSTSSHENALLLTALQSGRELGILEETDCNEIVHSPTSLAIPIKAIQSLSFRESRSARLTALTFLITSHSMTRPLRSSAMNLIKQSLPGFLTDVDADFRSDLVSLVQKLVDRIRAITTVLGRQVSTSETDNSVSDNSAEARLLAMHRNFLTWLIKFITWGLRPTASYQCHISALKCLIVLARSGLDRRVLQSQYSKSATGETKWAFRMHVVSRESQNLLLALVSDPFDDVRQTAALSLSLCVCSDVEHSKDFQAQLRATIDTAESSMLITGRADQADGIAHLHALLHQSIERSGSARSHALPAKSQVLVELVQKLDSMLHVAEANLSRAVERYPIHGILTSIRYIMDRGSTHDIDDLDTRAFNAVCRVWTIVRPVLCNDAPEGFLPLEMEALPKSTKETLSYCWRALKEASLLLARLMSAVRSMRSSPDVSLEREMADLCFAQLAELRHRGAFSTVAQTWTSICVLCCELKAPDESSLLDIWYGKVLSMLRDNVTINTRRSAGIPALLCGVLIADESGNLVTRAFSDLQSIARTEIDAVAAEEGSLPQVHSMNCIKDVLKSTRLGEFSERHVPEILRLAADALRSNVWAIRNCGLMLFRAVIDRLLGTSDAHFDESVILQRRISAEQYPEIIDVVLEMLRASAVQGPGAHATSEGVFPALQLLQYTKLSPIDLESFKTPIRSLLANASWHIRDKAAKTYASMWGINDALCELSDLLSNCMGHHNALHGVLLALRYLSLEGHPDMDGTSAKFAEDLLAIETKLGSVAHLVSALYRQSDCVIIKAACVDVLRSFFMLLDTTRKHEKDVTALPSNVIISVQTINAIQELVDVPAQGFGFAVIRQALARLCAHQIHKSAMEHRATLLSDLLKIAEDDSNSFAYFLTEVDSITRPSVDMMNLKRQICSKFLGSSTGVELKIAAQHVLLGMSSFAMIFANEEVGTHKFMCASWSNDINQHFVDQDLELHSSMIESALTKEHLQGEISCRLIQEWSTFCSAAIKGNGLHSREAAALSLHRIDHLWTIMCTQKELDDHFCNLCLAVYDLLNDDDEDIRIMAAKTTRRILFKAAPASAVDSPDMEPVTASRKLLHFCSQRWHNSQSFLDTVTTRAFPLSVPARHQLALHAQPETALFAKEKDNLYIDDANDVKTWSHVLLRMSPQAFSQTRMRELAEWVMDGLDALESHADGSYKEQIFTLGLRVVYGAELILHLAAENWIVSERPTDIRAQLLAAKTSLEKQGGSVLWIWEMERVYNESIRVKVARLGKLFELCNNIAIERQG